MKVVLDANVIISALIADSKTRELIVTLEPELLTPEIVREEIDNYEDLIIKKSGMEGDRLVQFMDLLFDHIKTVPASEFHPAIERADQEIGDTDPDDVLYLACALSSEASMWSDDKDFEEQNLVPVYTTDDVIDTFDTV